MKNTEFLPKSQTENIPSDASRDRKLYIQHIRADLFPGVRWF